MPATGLPRDREKLLSSPFIVSPDYGTRSSSVLALHDGRRRTAAMKGASRPTAQSAAKAV